MAFPPVAVPRRDSAYESVVDWRRDSGDSTLALVTRFGTALLIAGSISWVIIDYCTWCFWCAECWIVP